MVKGQEELVFLPLGGVGEIGMNAALYGFGPEKGRKWIMVDCGMGFAGEEQMPGVDLVALRQHDRPLDDVLELAQVARPGVPPQQIERLRGEPVHLLVDLRLRFPQEVVGEHRNVLTALPQRRQDHREGVEAVEEVFAELGGGQRLFEIAVGGRDHPDAHLAGDDVADRLHLARLQHA